MKILIVSPSFPYPPDKGASIRIYNLLKYLSCNNEVQLVSIQDRLIKDDDIGHLKKYCKKVYTVARKKYPRILQFPRVVERFLRCQPFMIKYAESKEMEYLLPQITTREKFDIVQFEHSYMARNIEFLDKYCNAKTILSLHNIASTQYYRVFNTEKNLYRKMKCVFEWVPMLSWEPSMATRFNKCVVVSETDRVLLRFLNPTLDVSVVPNGVDTKVFRPYPLNIREKNILIVGSLDYGPNADAVKYFYGQIFPIVRETIPEAKLTIVGKDPGCDIEKLGDDPAVAVHGNVADVRPFYEKAMISAVAVQSGGGTRLKIVESMALGTPVVSTAVGCEGFNVQDRLNILIANRPRDFADKIIQLFLSPDVWNKLSVEGRLLVEKQYDWEQISYRLENIYCELMTN